LFSARKVSICAVKLVTQLCLRLVQHHHNLFPRLGVAGIGHQPQSLGILRRDKVKDFMRGMLGSEKAILAPSATQFKCCGKAALILAISASMRLKKFLPLWRAPTYVVQALPAWSYRLMVPTIASLPNHLWHIIACPVNADANVTSAAVLHLIAPLLLLQHATAATASATVCT